MSEKIHTLSEGYDFIEESCGYMPLDFEEAIDAPIVESETGSSFRVIGIAKGPFQPMGEMSRNNRLYEADHWDIQLENLQFQDRIKSRDLLGTIGHHDKKVDDADIAAGIVSHIVTCLEKREDANGRPYLYGELEILDTPAGKNLKAMYEGGANLFVSSRGAGKLLPVPNESYKLVDKNNYFCETFDVVHRPGFLKAKPLYEDTKVQESLNENKETDYRKAKYEEAFDKWGETKKATLDWAGEKPETKKAYDEAMKAHKNLEKARADEKKIKESEVEVLKGQIEQLAQIVEKVVDSIYEKEEVSTNEGKKEALNGFVELMAQTNISEEVFGEILDIIKENK